MALIQQSTACLYACIHSKQLGHLCMKTSWIILKDYILHILRGILTTSLNLYISTACDGPHIGLFIHTCIMLCCKIPVVRISGVLQATTCTYLGVHVVSLYKLLCRRNKVEQVEVNTYVLFILRLQLLNTLLYKLNYFCVALHIL